MKGLSGVAHIGRARGIARISKHWQDWQERGVPLSGIFPLLGFLNPSLSRIDDIGRIQGIGRIGKDWQE